MFGDVVQTIFDREVTCSEFVNLCGGQSLQIRIASLGTEEEIALSPEDDRLRLMLLQKLLPLWIQVNVRPVVVEQIHLNLPAMRTLHSDIVVGIPVVGTNQFRIRRTRQIYGLDRVA